MQIHHDISGLRAALQGDAPVAFVPTMGNLHEGHLALVTQAREAVGPTGRIVASVFVNRLQFAPHEDFDRYPRTLQRDAELLAGVGCDLVFAPDEKTMYPEPQGYKVHPPTELADILEGHFRPGFFVGVCTVVHKLFNIVQPDVAVFGKKDYQQLMVLRRMVDQMALPIRILAGETRRSDTGLALSSRNGYLTDDEKQRALLLSQTLRGLLTAWRDGARDVARLEADAMQTMRDAGWLPDYMTLRRQHDLGAPQDGQPIVALGAAKLGQTRLIDNLEA
ncbi:pantoate--beta-alanine ligase [Roseateles depolymerans]|uniref:Pantothenate synthetase n=1 Tax=Roseateles depolymerans TaxID=76731 RepID=A0A0U3DV93_9BURK|nr:pantoate--beta-alanine ligase [Roseateles depolymerans]ALV04661.1 pantothenate synthetase [Roseateles depolymerans]REG09320.1 pantothenate synthetase [Roseateles depolymerans]